MQTDGNVRNATHIISNIKFYKQHKLSLQPSQLLASCRRGHIFLIKKDLGKMPKI